MTASIHVEVSILCFTVLGCSVMYGSPTNQPSDEISRHIRYSVTATNGLQLGVAVRASATNRTDQEIWLWFSREEEGTSVVYVPTDERLVRVELYDTNNVPLSKTAEGKKYKFAPLLRWDKSLVRQHQRTPQAWYVPKGRSVAQSEQGERTFYWEWSKFLALPPPTRLFKIEQPGTYRLVMEFQVFEKHGTNKNVVRFPPLEIPVVRADKLSP